MKRKLSIRTISLIMSVIICFVSLPMAAFAIELDYGADPIEASSSSSSTTESAASELQKEVMEMTELREETVKHFRLEDGTYTAVQYEMPIHYLDENGEWQDIDNTLSDSGSEYASSNARVKFVKKITGNESVFTLHEHNRKITMSLDGAKKKTEGSITNTVTEHGENATQLQKLTTLDKISASIIYKDILDGVDLEYVVISSNIKENIIVKERLDVYTFSFTVALNNLDAELLSDGSVNIFDASTNESVYIIPKGYMYDADGEFSDAVTYSLTDLENGKYTFTVSADPEWINSTNRTFPVTIDPPIYASQSTSNVTNAYINSNSPDTNYQESYYLLAGSANTLYWKSNALPNLPVSAYIIDARFTLYVDGTSNEVESSYLGAYQVTSSWDSSLTWNKHTASTSPQGTFGTEYVDFNNIHYVDGELQPIYSWNVTDIVKSWYRGIANYGIAISSISGYTTASLRFSSNDHSLQENRPKLCITYKDMKGVEDYWSYSSHSAGNAGSGSINLATGTLSFAIPTISTTDSLMPYTPTLVYNSALADKYNNVDNAEVPYVNTNFMTGRGFKWTMNETIVERTYYNEDGEASTYYVWSDSDGTEHYFWIGTNGIYIDEDGLLLTLSETTSTYTITDSNHNIRTFTKTSSDTSNLKAGGVLASITDKNGNKLTFVNDEKGRTTQITLTPNESSTSITFMTLSYNSSGAVSQITNSTANQTVKFYYSTTSTGTSILTTNAGYLRRVERIFSDGTYTSNYNYDSNGNLIKVRDEKSKYEINYTYTSGKITSVVEKGGSSSTTGQSIGINYSTGYTVVRTSGKDDIINNSDDALTRYSFDALGRAISVYSTDLSGTTIYGASSGEYVSDNEKAVNSLKSSLVVNGVSPNYILNGGFGKRVYNSTYGQYLTEWSTEYWSTSGSITENLSYGIRKYGINMGVSSTTSSSISQSVLLPAGEYTLSMYLDTNLLEDVEVTMKATSLNRTKVYSETYSVGEQNVVSLNITAGDYVNSGEKFTVSISVSGGSGTPSGSYVTVDDVMISNGIGIQPYDFVSLGHFETIGVNTTFAPNNIWGLSGGTFATAETNTVFGTALVINGDLNKEQYAYQPIYHTDVYEVADSQILMTGEATFRITGFAKGTWQTDNASSAFRLRVEIVYDSGYTKTETFDFNNYQTDWQFLSGTFTICDPYGDSDERAIVKRIMVYCDYFNNPGTAYFDNITVTRVEDDFVDYKYDNTTGLPISRRSSITDKEWYFYNSYGDMIKKISSSDRTVIEYSYDSKNNLAAETVSKYTGWYNETTNSFESRTYMTQTRYSYNKYGLLTQTGVGTYIGSTSGDPYDIKLTTQNTYNLGTSSRIFGSLASSTDSLGNVTEYFYDESNGNLLAVKNPDGTTGIVYTYDGSGRMTKVRPATFSGSNYYGIGAEYAQYTYNTLGSLESIRTDTTQYNISYDAFGNTDYISVGSTEIVDYTYNSNNGKLNTITYGNGFTESYVYDALDRIVEIYYNGIKTYEYSYDSNGNIYKVHDIPNDSVIVYSYDSNGRLVKMIECDATSLDLTSSIWQFYDDESRVDGIYYTTAYGVNSYYYHDYSIWYNNQGSVRSVSISLNGSVTDDIDVNYTYDDLQRATVREVKFIQNETTRLNIKTNYAFKPNGTNTSLLVSRYTSTVNNATTNTYNYTYDANGNITEITNASGAVQNKYYYDDIGQLIREDNKALGKAFVYAYDNAGNRTSKKTYELPNIETGTLGALQSTETYSYPSNSDYTYWGDQLTSINGNTITYDDVGNPLEYYLDYIDEYRLFDLDWEGRNLVYLGEYAAGELDIYYEYNDEGIRTSKDVGGTEYKYTLNGSQIVSQEWEDKFIIFFYDDKGAPIGYAYRTTSMAADAFYYYVFEKNLQGDIVAVYNTSGTKLISYTYDAWGNVTAKNEVTSLTGVNAGAQYNPFRYRGYYYDEEVGLYYLNSRYYDPRTGRFLNADVIDVVFATPDALTDKNLYAYCDNNPIMRVDNGGEFWNFIIGAAVGAIAGGVVAALDGGDATKIIIGAFAGGLSGFVAATGLGWIAQAGISAAISGVAEFANQTADIVQNNGNIRDYNLGKIGVEAILGGATSAVGSGLGFLAGKYLTGTANLADQAFDNYLGKTFSAKMKAEIGSSTSALIRQAKKYLAKSVFYDNVTKGVSSVIGSVVSLWNIAR